MNQIRKKRKFELGRPPTNTKVLTLKTPIATAADGSIQNLFY